MIRELVRVDRYNSHIAASALRLLAAQRMVLYTGMLAGSKELPLWRGWLERIDKLHDVEDPDADEQLALDEIRLSTELCRSLRAFTRSICARMPLKENTLDGEDLA